MADSNAPQETFVTAKSPEAAKDAPPSLAEPASGPVAEMTGALPVGQPAPKPSPSPANVPPTVSEPVTSTEASTTVNGTTQPTEDKAEPVSTTTETPAVPSAEADKPSEEKPAEPVQAPVDQDTDMKDADAAPTAEADADANPATNGAAASKAKRKSTGGVPEHKSKTLKKKQSKAKITHLDAKPGDYYLARLKSYPPWPAIICDEDMLPDVLLNSRPKTAIKDDGSYHEDYAEGGKKVSERTYAVMFLHTNEFGWIPNTDLQPLDPESCKDTPEKGKSKMLIEAYKVAAENHDLDHFKEVLMAHDAALQEEETKQAERQAAKAAKADKKPKRKSEAKAADSDTEMADADDAATSKKAFKKRKKDAETDEEGPEKPAKTPKTTKLKLTTGKTPTTDKKTKEKAPAKPKADKKKKTTETEDEKEVEKDTPPKDPVQARKDQEKEVLFLRHKLQKGFLSRDQEPSEDEMPQMANFIKKLEGYGASLDASIIRTTKINKVLKGILKLSAIPKDDEYHFKDRSAKILADWAHVLGTEPTDATTAKKDSPPTNGVHKEAEEKADEKIAPTVEEPKDNTMTTEETVEKTSAELPVEAGVKADAIEAIQSEEKPAEEAKTETAAPAVEDKAPESAAAAAEATEVVKATE